MNVIRTIILANNHLDITFLLRNSTSNIAGNKHNEFGRISNMIINPAKAQDTPQKGIFGIANEPKKKMNRAIDIGNSVDITIEYQSIRGKAMSANCPHSETSLAR